MLGTEQPGGRIGQPARASVIAQPARTAAEVLVDWLEAEGCGYVFSVPGQVTMDVLDSLSRSETVRHVTPVTSRVRPSWPTYTGA